MVKEEAQEQDSVREMMGGICRKKMEVKESDTKMLVHTGVN